MNTQYLIDLVNNQLPDNTIGAITPTRLRTVLFAIIAGEGGLNAVTFHIGNLTGNKPAGDTLQDDALIGKTPTPYFILDNQTIQWQVANIQFNATTGTFSNISATIGGLQNDSNITILYQ